MKKLLAWVVRNEHHISTAVFVGGFIVDLIAYNRVELPVVENLFAGFLIASALCIIVSHVLRRERPDAAASVRRPWHTLLPIAAQFFLGGLLSGCLIFYTRSANLSASWPFILLLAAIFLGNELLHKYRHRLAFQSALFFFTLYAYAIFALPIARGKMSALIFVESGLVSLVIFIAYLCILWFISKKGLKESLRRILISVAVILGVVNLFYFTDILPPLPLALKDAGVYYSVTHTGTGYEVTTGESSWHLFGPDIVEHVPGTPLYAYSAVFAPIALTTPIVHRWEKYNEVTHAWDTLGSIAFPISGGRDDGYRGYSEFTDVSAGIWRVSIETESGSVLGRVPFTVQEVSAPPTLYSEVK